MSKKREPEDSSEPKQQGRQLIITGNAISPTTLPAAKGKSIVKEMFSQAKIAMIQECKEHPELMAELSQYQPDDWGGAVGEIAAYCLVTMEGSYYPSELEKLYEILYFKLRGKRAAIINTVMRSKL